MAAMIFRRVLAWDTVPAGQKYHGATTTWNRTVERLVCGHEVMHVQASKNGRRRCRECEQERWDWGEAVYDEQAARA